MPTTNRLLGIFTFAVVVLLLGQQRQEIRRWQGTADSLRVEVNTAKANLTVARARTDSQAIRVRRRSQRVQVALDTLGVALDTARSALADSVASSEKLRASLAQTVAASDRLRAEVLTYRQTIDSLLTTHLVERQEAAGQIQALQALADTQEMRLLQGRCPGLFGRCPTRWQAFGIGILATVAVLAL